MSSIVEKIKEIKEIPNCIFEKLKNIVIEEYNKKLDKKRRSQQKYNAKHTKVSNLKKELESATDNEEKERIQNRINQLRANRREAMKKYYNKKKGNNN